jgi:hypothetical protein
MTHLRQMDILILPTHFVIAEVPPFSIEKKREGELNSERIPRCLQRG